MIASLSGIRGIPNADITMAEVSMFAANFGRATGSKEFLLARDSRSTGPAMSRAVAAGIMSLGATVFNYGIISTPAIFRESRLRRLPAVMVTASHNEPEFNGLKFVVEGAGIGREMLEAITGGLKARTGAFGPGSLRATRKPSYVEDLVERFGAGSCEGVRVAVDLGGGAAVSHTVPLLRRLGCEVASMNDSCGVFSRRVDPVADDLTLLRKVVKRKGCDIGLGFDCDGDRLAIVDSEGRKRTGDYALTVALSEMFTETREKKVVVSIDTTQAVDDIAENAGAQVLRTDACEADIVRMMRESGARLGGEGGKGGLIDGSFNYCMDALVAACAIVKNVKTSRRGYESLPHYFQSRNEIPITKARFRRAIKELAKTHAVLESKEGLRIELSKHSWLAIVYEDLCHMANVLVESDIEAVAVKESKNFASKLKTVS